MEMADTMQRETDLVNLIDSKNIVGNYSLSFGDGKERHRYVGVVSTTMLDLQNRGHPQVLWQVLFSRESFLHTQAAEEYVIAGRAPKVADWAPKVNG